MSQIISVKLKYLHIAPRKARFVADLLKGLRADEAEAQLMFSSRRPSKPLLKLLQSAIANAKHNHQLDKEKLYVKSIAVNNGPMSKRFTPRARGSASEIQKKTSHINLVLGVRDETQKLKFNIKLKDKKTKQKEKVKEKKTQEKENKKLESGEKINKQLDQPKFFQKMFRRKSI